MSSEVKGGADLELGQQTYPDSETKVCVVNLLFLGAWGWLKNPAPPLNNVTILDTRYFRYKYKLKLLYATTCGGSP